MQRKWKIAAVTLVSVLVLGTAAAVAAPRAGGLEEIGQKVYWSLLTDGQKAEAKAIAADYLADVAPDRLGAAARLMRLKADVAGVLTKEQRIEAGKLGWIAKNLPKEKRREHFAELLASTDREALAGRVEKLQAATPEERVTLGIEIIDQIYDAAEPKLAARLSLTEEQRRQIRVLVGAAKTDLQPVAVRLATAKAAAVAKGLALLDTEQKKKLDSFRDGVRAKILSFIRGK
jgi:hypothetical protein